MTISQPYGYPVQIDDPTIPPLRVGADTAEFDNVTRAAISAEMRRQRERIQELLTRNTELLEELRAVRSVANLAYQWRAQAFACHKLAADKGWWSEDAQANALLQRGKDEGDSGLAEAGDSIANMKTFTALALVISEVCEGIEGLRVGAESEKIPGFKNIEEELADAVIRIMDLGYARGWRVAEAIEAKHKYNQSRSYRHGGKLA